jgi:hypothetical protein
MPPTARRSSKPPGGAEPGAPASGAVSSQPATPPGAGQGSAAPDERATLTLHLPLVTLSVSRPSGARARPGATPPGPATAPGAGSGGQRLLFYAGVAALGVAGVVEWPVAAAIAAGTYIAARSRPAAPPPVPGPPRAAGRTPPGVATAAPVEPASGAAPS